MKIKEYREYLQWQAIPEDIIEKQMSIIGDFGQFLPDFSLKEFTAVTAKKAVNNFARKLVAEDRNTLENFSFLRDYASWIGQRNVHVALIELIDCHNALKVLSDKIEEGYGQEIHDQIFVQALPPIGADEKERCACTRRITGLMARQITPGESRGVWFQVQHGIPASDWHTGDIADKEKYRQCGSIHRAHSRIIIFR